MRLINLLRAYMILRLGGAWERWRRVGPRPLNWALPNPSQLGCSSPREGRCVRHYVKNAADPIEV
jgi:hypothetical protein